jgi:ABC-type glycerol-3-phosphate transport system substrate-binding protein
LRGSCGSSSAPSGELRRCGLSRSEWRRSGLRCSGMRRSELRHFRLRRSEPRLSFGALWLLFAAMSCLAMSCLFVLSWPTVVQASESLYMTTTSLMPYRHYFDRHRDADRPDDIIELDLFAFDASDEMHADVQEDSVITGERGEITWVFSVERAGCYGLDIEYLTPEGKSSAVQRELRLDGAVPFEGAHQILFSRTWVDEGPITEKHGNEIRPNQVEAPRWQTAFVSDSQKYTPGPFEFYLSEGTHELTLVSVREPLQIRKLLFRHVPEVPTYEEYIADKQQKYSIYDGPIIKFQAERVGAAGNQEAGHVDGRDGSDNDGQKDSQGDSHEDNHTVAIRKSSPTLHPISNFSSPRLEPCHPYNIRLNTIGGYQWRVIGDWISWDVQVEEEGLYQLSLSVLQNTKRGAFSSRQLRVNGEVPFEEAYTLEFKYDTAFQMYTVGDEKGPYLIHLKEGINTIELQSTLGRMGPIIQEVKESVVVLNDLYRQITQITGLTPEKYIDYQLERKLPHMLTTFERESERLSRLVGEVERIAGDRSDQTAILNQMAVQLRELVDNPRKVIRQVRMLQSNISALSTWILAASEQPLEIDYFILSSPGSALPRVKPGFLEGLYFSAVRFASTFFVDYNAFRADSADGSETIEVWFQSGRDQVQILRNLIDNTFTPRTGISVDLKLVPQGVVLPATLAGEGPDVALGLWGDTTINFAMRGAAYDLSQFDDFDEVASQFAPCAFDVVKYQGGVYGLPETQNFFMLFYRKDVLTELGLEVPETWEDVYDMIPYLEMNNYEFYVPNTLQMYATLVYQMRGEIYLGEGNDLGIKSGLSSREAMEAFEKWTDFFTSYKLPVEANFYNRFRTGEMPIGIAEYTIHNTLSVFAPEINGLWGFAVLPGIEQPDGTINNQSVSTVNNCMMLSDAENKQVSWEFMKWWTSVETQVSYGRGLEAVMGAAARYSTANVEAVARLPWDSKSYDQLSEQFRNLRTIPEVPGGYITSRHVDYALRAVLNDGQNPREALYENVKVIDEELTIKRLEFGLSTLSGRRIEDGN